MRGGALRRAARLTHRGRQQIRLVLLWFNARRVRAGDWDETRDGNRRVLGNDLRAGLGRGGQQLWLDQFLVGQTGGNWSGRACWRLLEDQLSLVQRDRLRGCGGRGNVAESD